MTKTFCDLCMAEIKTINGARLYTSNTGVTFWKKELCSHCLDRLKERLRDFAKERSRPTC